MTAVGKGLLIVLIGSQVSCQRSAESYLSKGDKLVSEGKYAEAEINFRNALKKQPNLADAHYRLGMAAEKLGARVEAYHELVGAAKLAPDRDDIKIELANLSLELYGADPQKPKFLYDQVLAAETALLTKNPNSFDGLRLQASRLALDNRLDESVTAFQKADAIKPLEPTVIDPLVQELFRLKQSAEGERLAHALIEAHKDFGHIYRLLASYYVQTGRAAEAEAVLKLQVANMPKDPVAIVDLAGFYSQQKREPEMIEALSRLSSQNYQGGRMIAGDFYAGAGKYDEAIREYSEGLRANPKEGQHYGKKITKVLIAQGKGQEAIDRLDKVLKANPDDLDGRLARAILLGQSRDPKQRDLAVTELNAILEKTPNNEVAHYNLGLLYLDRRDSANGVKQLAESARLNASFLPPRLKLAELSQEMRNYGEAIRYASQVLEVQPQNAEARLWRCAGLIGSGNYKQARSELTPLLRDYPDSPMANLHMAILDTVEKKYKDAEAIYQRLYQPGAQDPRPLEGLIQVYLAQKQQDKAIKLLDQEIKQAPDSKTARLLLGQVASQSGNLDLAAQQYEWLRDKDPKSVQAYASLGDIYQLKGDLASALASYRQASQVAPNDPKVIAMVAYLQSVSGQSQEAITSLKRQLALDPENAIALNNLAMALAESGADLDNALAMAEKARRKLPDNPGVADTIGWVYTKKGLNESAVQTFRGLVKKHPDEPAYRYHLAVALAQEGKLEEAKSELTIGLAAKPPKDLGDRMKAMAQKIG
jgi:tetratricopeptide (TPR) repeat protein